MGNVYAAYDIRLGRRVALKLLRPDLAADTNSRQRFLREAQIAAQIIHPNVVRTYDVGDSAEGPYLVQELLNGRTLDTQIPLPPERAIDLVIDVADALAYIHARGYVHCDIKPHNIMLVEEADGTTRVVLLDFGIARAEGTDTTILIATPHYLAPERSQGAPPTAASDLYALGIMLYQSLTGKLPFDGTTQHTIIQQHLYVPLPPLKVESPHAPILETIVRKLTAKQPEARYASATALHADLLTIRSGALHAQPTAVVRHPPLAPPPRPPAIRTIRMLRMHLYHRIRRWRLGLPLLLLIGMLGLAIIRGLAPGIAPAEPASPGQQAQPQAPTLVESPQNTSSVPNVIDLPVAEAQRLIEQVGLIFVAGDVVPSDQPTGIVLSTNPDPGQLVVRGSQVVVQTSAGPMPTAEPAPVIDQVTPPEDDEADENDKRDEDDEVDKDKGKDEDEKGKRDEDDEVDKDKGKDEDEKGKDD